MRKQKGFASVLLILIVILVSVGGLFYYGVTNGNLLKTTDPNLDTTRKFDEQMKEPSTTNSIVDTSKWKTYLNEKYGFSFQYPSDSLVQESEQGKKVIIWFPKPTGDVDQESMDLSIEENPKGLSPREIVEADIRDLRKKDPTLQFVADKEERSLKSYKSGTIEGVSFESGADYDFDLILFTHNSYIYTVSSTHYNLPPGETFPPEETVTKIISSFKFLN